MWGDGKMAEIVLLCEFGESQTKPSVESVLSDIKRLLAEYDFGGFWFQGVANSAYRDYLQNNQKAILSRRALRSRGGVFASSPKISLLHEQYVTRVAPTDINFGQALRIDSPYCYEFYDNNRPNKAKKLFARYGINTVLSWPLKHFASDAWCGRFTLLSKHPYAELELNDLEAVLKQAQMRLFEHFHHELNPYRQNNLFNQTAIKALKMAATGLHNHEISEALHITVRGVEYHLESMRNKLSASNRANLVHIAHQLEII